MRFAVVVWYRAVRELAFASRKGAVFEWDDEKARRNVDLYGIAFEEAAEVCFDPFFQYGDATPAGVREPRDFILGYSAAQRLPLVLYTERTARTRSISARPTSRAERNLYEST